MTFIPSLAITSYGWFPWSICNGCSMPAGNAYSSGHLVPSPHCGTCMCSDCWDQFPRTCPVYTRLLISNTPWYFLDFAFNKVLFTCSHLAAEMTKIQRQFNWDGFLMGYFEIPWECENFPNSLGPEFTWYRYFYCLVNIPWECENFPWDILNYHGIFTVSLMSHGKINNHMET